jgi:hypothetical protein
MYKDGQTRVQSPSELLNIPDVAKKIAGGMEVSTAYLHQWYGYGMP